MSQNFFLDNPDLQLRLEHLDLREVLELKEKGYAESDIHLSLIHISEPTRPY